MKPPPFDYRAVGTVEEAVAALSEGGDGAKLLAGGQSLVPLLALRLVRPELVVDINGVRGLDYVELHDRRLRIGALARHRAVERDARVARRFPLVVEAVSKVGHVAIRNRGTVGGSLAHADPAAEWPALLLALDGEVEVAGPAGRRVISGEELFVSYLETSLDANEVLCEARFRLPAMQVGTSFLEFARRDGDFAIVGVAAVLALEYGAVSHCRIALSGAGGTAVRARGAEERLAGGPPGDGEIEEAAALVAEEIGPPSDIHGSAEYRRKVARVLVRRALVTARERAADREQEANWEEEG